MRYRTSTRQHLHSSTGQSESERAGDGRAGRRAIERGQPIDERARAARFLIGAVVAMMIPGQSHDEEACMMARNAGELRQPGGAQWLI